MPTEAKTSPSAGHRAMLSETSRQESEAYGFSEWELHTNMCHLCQATHVFEIAQPPVEIGRKPKGHVENTVRRILEAAAQKRSLVLAARDV